MAEEDRWYRKALGHIWTSEGKEFPNPDNSFKMSKTSIILKLEKQRQESLVKMKEFEEKISSDEWKKRRLKDVELDSMAKKLKRDSNSVMKIKIKNLRLDKEQSQEVEQWDGSREPSTSKIGHVSTRYVESHSNNNKNNNNNNNNNNGTVHDSGITPSSVVDQPVVVGLAQINKSLPSLGGSGSRDKEETIPSRDKQGSNFVEVGNSSIGSSQTTIQTNHGENILSSPEKNHAVIPKMVSPAPPSISFSRVRFNMGNLQKRNKKGNDSNEGDSGQSREPTDGVVNSAKVDSVVQESKTYSEKTLKSIQSQLKI